MPQLRVPPQPSATEPQFLPSAAQLVGVQPQTLAVPPPPQVWGEVHVPQLRVPPQPSRPSRSSSRALHRWSACRRCRS